MKIILHSTQDVRDFLDLMGSPGLAPPDKSDMININLSPADIAQSVANLVAEGEARSHAPIRGTAVPVHETTAQPETCDVPEAIEAPELDSNGLPHDERIHSVPAKANADGSWRARRGVDKALVAEVEAVLRAAMTEVEPVATETHALPVDTEAEPTQEVPFPSKVDLIALIEGSKEAAGDLPGGMVELLAAGREFISKHGTDALAELKQAVAPTEDGKGKSMQELSPAQRCLLTACLANYDLYL